MNTQTTNQNQTTTTEEREAFGYTLYITGLFGRNRKAKFQGFSLVEDVDAKLTDDRVRELAIEKLRAVRVKGTAKVKVAEQPYKLGQDGVFTTRSFFFGSGTTRLHGVASADGSLSEVRHA